MPSPSVPSPFRRDANWQRDLPSQPGRDADWPRDSTSPPKREANWQRDSRGYTNQGRSNFRDRDRYPPPPPPPLRQDKPRFPTGRSADVHRWVTQNGRNSRLELDVERGEPNRQWSRNSADRFERVNRDDTLGPGTPPRTSQPELPQQTPSSAYRGYAGSACDQSEAGWCIHTIHRRYQAYFRCLGSSVSRRAPSVSTQAPISSRSEFWEDTYGRDERDDPELSGSGSRTVVSTSRSRSPTSSSVGGTARYGENPHHCVS